MAEQATEEVIEQVDTQATEQADSQEIDYKAEYEKSLETVNKLKSDNAGLDRKIGELSNSFNEFRATKETEKEKAQREAEEKQKAEQERLDNISKREAEIVDSENALNIKLKAVELGVDLNDIAELGLNTVEQVEKYKAKLDSFGETKKAETAENISKQLSGKRDNYTNDSKGDTIEPKFISKAFR